MNTALHIDAPSAHEKTIDLRIARLREAVDHATTLHQHASAGAVPDATARRLIAVLIENRTLVSAHTGALIDHTVRTVTPADQDEHLYATVRPLTLLLEEANIALARTRHLLTS